MSRRAVLAAVTAVGGVGALTGAGTAAYLRDEETLGPNEMHSGAVYLDTDGGAAGNAELAFDVDDYGFEARDQQTLCIGLGAESNPGWVWIRSCPRTPDAENELAARVSVDGTTVYSGTLGGLLTALSGGDGGGVLLTEFAGEAATPLAPGPDTAICLTVAIWVPDTLAGAPAVVRRLKAASPLSFVVDVYAEQSRHVETPRRPVVGGTNPSFSFPACDPGETQDEPPGHAISNVWLCTDDPVDPAGVSWTVLDPTTGSDVTGFVDEAFVVQVTSPVPVNYAVVKAGTEMRRFEADGSTTVTVTSTGGTLLTDGTSPRCACDGEGVKLDDWDEAVGDFTVIEAKSCADTGSSRGPESNAQEPEPESNAQEPQSNDSGNSEEDTK
jgi:hypothetical protein